MNISRVIGQLSGRISLLQVASGELKPCYGLASAGFARKLSMSNNMELPAQYEVASQRLASALGCSKQESCAILIEFPEIKKLKSTHMTARCDYLTKELGIPSEQVISFPWLLQMSRSLLNFKNKVDN
jgi:mTERF